MKAYRVNFRPAAEADLFGLYEYIVARSGRQAAARYVDRIEATCMGLARTPMRGRSRDDIRSGLRTLGFERRALIAFVVGRREVEVVRILYGGRDFEALLSDSDGE